MRYCAHFNPATGSAVLKRESCVVTARTDLYLLSKSSLFSMLHFLFFPGDTSIYFFQCCIFTFQGMYFFWTTFFFLSSNISSPPPPPPFQVTYLPGMVWADLCCLIPVPCIIVGVYNYVGHTLKAAKTLTKDSLIKVGFAR